MTSNFRQALALLREQAGDTTELGTSFEKLVKVFLEHDATQTQQYQQVWHYREWAPLHGYPLKDIGIDLVAKRRDAESYCAIQCKCYDEQTAITKEALDSFVSAASTKDFTRLLLIDTSSLGISPNAQQVLDNLDREYLRINTAELENSRIDWVTCVREDRVRLRSKYGPREHQAQAVAAVAEGLKTHDRGKLIMACGTGKTFTALLIAEQLAGKGKNVLYMVPSLALMSQTLREWKNDATDDFTAFSACSDITVGSRKDDDVIVSIHDLAFPATTNANDLAAQVARAPRDKMTVVFSTYHSVDVIASAQKEHGLPPFDLIVCDEAHRTTGATLAGEDESAFVKIHSDSNVAGAKRLYMTATPRIFGDQAKAKADDGNVALASMDDETTYGPLLFHRGFGWAVENGLLTDYKVVVLAVDEGVVSESVQQRLAQGAELKLDDATKIVGCYKALGKVGFKEPSAMDSVDTEPMRRALAFCQSIKLSKLLAAEFGKVVDEYCTYEAQHGASSPSLTVEVQHVDGSFDADVRTERLNWLRTGHQSQCRVLTNVRCLSEGVDVPALDAVIFMHPRKSQIDVVQSVGRVMRLSPDKSLGYVIIPITVAPGVSAEKALNDNERYRVVWQILNALRSHDERFDSTINRIGLGEDVSERLEIVGVGARKELEATTAVVPDVRTTPKSENTDHQTDADNGTTTPKTPEQLPFIYADLSRAIKAKIVQRCGTRDYWEQWATDIAKIAQAHITRIQSIVLNDGTPERAVFDEFVHELRDDLNPSVSRTDAIEMLAQHLVTKPVFDTLFRGSPFTAQNAVSRAMESVLDALHAHDLGKESASLERFYDSVRRRAADIVTTTGRQTLILELYERFFRSAFPTMTERLGIVYTPVEVVDFIIQSVEDVLRDEFGSSMSSKGVHVLDPFTGTGTFVTRLLQSNVISDADLARKYASELHANEIVLLAYYIASLNIESVFHERTGKRAYVPFEGIVLTDTFQLYEDGEDILSKLLPDNSSRRKRQKERRINVIIGNPPYSSGQTSANDNAANLKYPKLDARIEDTYAKESSANNKNSLYDSYIRAFRLASDRIGDEGVIGFVSGAGWIDGNAADGMRKTLSDEFAKIYVFHLRGNQRTSGETSRKEGGKIFGSGSRSPIAITILVKKKERTAPCEIRFCDIGDYYDRDEKLALIRHYGSIAGIEKAQRWERVSPDSRHDWLNQREERFEHWMPIGTKTNGGERLFEAYSAGLKTNRDAWNCNYSKARLEAQVSASIAFYNEMARSGVTPATVVRDPKRISWDRGAIQGAASGRLIEFKPSAIRESLYRPFTRQFAYIDAAFNDCVYRLPQLFPDAQSANRVIVVAGAGSDSDFCALMTDKVPNVHLVHTGQAFPLWWYPGASGRLGLLDDGDSSRKSAIASGARMDVSRKYGRDIGPEELFYFVYGLLHSPEYKGKFEANLGRTLPRIPFPDDYKQFALVSECGRRLGDLHVGFDRADKYPLTITERALLNSGTERPQWYRVTRMRFAGSRNAPDRTCVIYNDNITISGIPEEAYEYVVNRKSALEWVMERQCVTTDKDSGIVNDANDFANETMNNPAYPLELFQRVITVSLETMKIVRELPTLDL